MLFPIPGVLIIHSHMFRANTLLYLLTPLTSITVEASSGLIHTSKAKKKSRIISGEFNPQNTLAKMRTTQTSYQRRL